MHDEAGTAQLCQSSSAGPSSASSAAAWSAPAGCWAALPAPASALASPCSQCMISGAWKGPARGRQGVQAQNDEQQLSLGAGWLAGVAQMEERLQLAPRIPLASAIAAGPMHPPRLLSARLPGLRAHPPAVPPPTFVHHLAAISSERCHGGHLCQSVVRQQGGAQRHLADLHVNRGAHGWGLQRRTNATVRLARQRERLRPCAGTDMPAFAHVCRRCVTRKRDRRRTCANRSCPKNRWLADLIQGSTGRWGDTYTTCQGRRTREGASDGAEKHEGEECEPQGRAPTCRRGPHPPHLPQHCMPGACPRAAGTPWPLTLVPGAPSHSTASGWLSKCFKCSSVSRPAGSCSGIKRFVVVVVAGAASTWQAGRACTSAPRASCGCGAPQCCKGCVTGWSCERACRASRHGVQDASWLAACHASLPACGPFPLPPSPPPLRLTQRCLSQRVGGEGVRVRHVQVLRLPPARLEQQDRGELLWGGTARRSERSAWV